jgi:hypothetical protein
MDVCQRAEELVDVKFDLQDRHDSLHLVEISRSTVDGLGDIFEDQVEIDLVSLCLISQLSFSPKSRVAYPIAVAVVECLQFHDIWVPHDSHDLKLTILRVVLASTNKITKKYHDGWHDRIP